MYGWPCCRRNPGCTARVPVHDPGLSVTESLVLAAIAGALIAAAAPGRVSAQVRAFGAATFSPPAGWALEAGPTAQTLTFIRGSDLCLVRVYGDQPSPPSLAQAFAGAWTNVFRADSYRSAPQPAPADRVSPAGYRHFAGESEIIDRAGNRFVARLHVFPVGALTQTVVLVANSRAALEACRPDWDTFFASLAFPSVGRVAAGDPQATTPTGTGRDLARAAEVAVGDGGVSTFDNITFAPPAGWRVERTTGGINLEPTDTRGPEALRVTLLPGRRSTASLEQELAATWSEVLAALRAEPMRTVNGGPYDLDEPGRSLRGWDYLRGAGGMRVGGSPSSVTVYVIRAGDRVERVAIVASDFRDNLTPTNASLNPRYQREIQKLVFTMQFASAGAGSATPATVRGGGIVGVWAGLALSFGRFKRHIAIFFDDGTAYFGPFFPPAGLLDIDPSVEQPFARRYWGSHTFRNGSGTVSLPAGDVALLATPPSLRLTVNQQDHSFTRLYVPNTTQLEGTWCIDDQHCLRFGKDGRFDDTGAVRLLEHANYPYPESPPAGNGQYEIRDYTLLLRYAGGPQIRLALGGVGDANAAVRDLMIGFNLDVLTRR
jgi:hypothetical protein